MWTRALSLTVLAAALMASAVASEAVAQHTVKVGAIYPLSGNAASAGGYSKAAIELAVEIVNNDHPELKDHTLLDGRLHQTPPRTPQVGVDESTRD